MAIFLVFLINLRFPYLMLASNRITLRASNPLVDNC